jgi:CRP-like cAMP-binding protein
MQTELKNLFKNHPLKKVEKNKVIILEGDPVDKIYFIVSGYIKVYTVINSGAQRIVFIYKAGDIFPLTTYLSGSSIARFFYETMAPTQMHVMTAKKFEEKMVGNTEAGESLIRYTTKIDRQFLRRVRDIVAPMEPQDKLIRVLFFLMSKTGSGKDEVHINLPLTLRDIANMCGITREETAKHLVYLKNKGVTYNSNSFMINKTKLKALAKKT